jgi:phosphatidylserine/phosphatidylglycerophosphate/cardiolipin synthase-like enzyme
VTDRDDSVDVQFLTDGGQPAEQTAQRLFGFLAEARSTLDIAVYDAHFDDDTGTRLVAALDAAEARGVRVRAVYNDIHRHRTAIPPPGPSSLLQRLAAAVPAEAISGIPDLMHHKYVVRDGKAVWTGSTNWTGDAWTRMENVIVVVASADVAAAYTQDFEQLWTKREVEHTGTFDDAVATFANGMTVRVLFSPGRGRKMGQLVATRIGQARDRIRICSPVLTSSPILATLAEVLDDGGCDARITVDGPQMAQALAQWRLDGRASWKGPLYQRIVASGAVAAKASTPYAPTALHDYMHAKLVVCDDWVLTGSYNCSHSGELNAENLLEIHDRAVADRCAAFCEQVHERYAATT